MFSPLGGCDGRHSIQRLSCCSAVTDIAAVVTMGGYPDWGWYRQYHQLLVQFLQ